MKKKYPELNFSNKVRNSKTIIYNNKRKRRKKSKAPIKNNPITVLKNNYKINNKIIPNKDCNIL